MEEPKIKSLPGKAQSYILWMFTAYSAVLIFFAGFFFKSAFDDIYPDLAYIFIGCIFLFLVLVLAFIFWRVIKKIELYNNRMVVKSVFDQVRKTIFLNQILNWSEDEGRFQEMRTLLSLHQRGSTCYQLHVSFPNYSEIRGFSYRRKKLKFLRRRWQKLKNRKRNTQKSCFCLVLCALQLPILECGQNRLPYSFRCYYS